MKTQNETSEAKEFFINALSTLLAAVIQTLWGMALGLLGLMMLFFSPIVWLAGLTWKGGEEE